MVTDTENLNEMIPLEVFDEYENLVNDTRAIIERLTLYLYAIEREKFGIFERIRYNPMSQFDYGKYDDEGIVTITFCCEFDTLCGFMLLRKRHYDWCVISCYSDGQWNGQYEDYLDYDASVELEALIEKQRKIDYIDYLRNSLKERVPDGDNEPLRSCTHFNDDDLSCFVEPISELDFITMSSPFSGMTTLLYYNGNVYYTNPLNLM